MTAKVQTADPTLGTVTLMMTLAEAEEIVNAISVALRFVHEHQRPDGPVSQVLQGIVDAVTTRPPRNCTSEVQLIAGQPL